MSFLESLASLLFPPRCAFCGKPGVHGVCSECEKALPYCKTPLHERAEIGACLAPLKYEGIVREALLPEGGRLMTIAFEYAGKLVQPAERMEIALPIVLAEGEAFTLLNPDGTETAVECVSDAETTRVILEYPEEIDAERVDPETNLVRLLRAVPVVQ